MSADYAVLGDAERRAHFDRGEIDTSGAERPQRRYYREFADPEAESSIYTSTSGLADFDDAGDILSAFFARTGGPRNIRMRGADRTYRLEVDFLNTVNGGTRRITLPDASTLDFVIPPGIRDDQVRRLKGNGETGPGGGEAGDALIEMVRPHPFFKRDGDDILLDLPISFVEAALGGKASVPTPTGPVAVTIPKESNTGKVLRLKGKGVPVRDGRRGDQYLTLQVMLQDRSDPELEAFAASWPAGGTYNPRRGMEA